MTRRQAWVFTGQVVLVALAWSFITLVVVGLVASQNCVRHATEVAQ